MARTSDPHAATVKAWETRRRVSHTDRPDESEGLGQWGDDGSWKFNDSADARSWGSGRGVAPGDVPVPFPVWTEDEQSFVPGSDDYWYGKRPVDKETPAPKAVKAGTMKVKLADLIATQHVVTERSVRNNVGYIMADMKQRSNPIIVRYKGKSFIWDGHHRCSAAKIMGMDEVVAEVFDIPEPPGGNA